MFTIIYQIPYPTYPFSEEWRTESFETKQQAESRIKFYLECGSPAKFV